MLIHKATMGVLAEVWTGTYARNGQDGSLIPIMRPVRLADYPELSPEDWWELPNRGALAKKVLRYYPMMRPVVDDAGQLADVIPLCPERDAEALRMEQLKRERQQEAARRGYKQARRVRPRNLLSFLGGAQ